MCTKLLPLSTGQRLVQTVLFLLPVAKNIMHENRRPLLPGCTHLKLTTICIKATDCVQHCLCHQGQKAIVVHVVFRMLGSFCTPLHLEWALGWRPSWYKPAELQWFAGAMNLCNTQLLVTLDLKSAIKLLCTIQLFLSLSDGDSKQSPS